MKVAVRRTPRPLLVDMIDYFSLDLASGGLVGLHAGIEFTNTGCTAGESKVYASTCGIVDDGSNRYLQSNDDRLKAITTPGAAFEFAIWIKYTTHYTTKPPYRAVCRNGNGYRGLDIKGAGDALQTAFIVGKALPGNYFLINHASPTPAGSWFLGHFQFDAGETSRLGASVNGDALSYTTSESGLTDVATDAFSIGWNGGNDHMDGMIGPMAIWSRKLTDAERAWIYNSGSGRTYAAMAAWTGG